MKFLDYLGLEHYHSLLLGLFVKQEALANYYTKAEADILHTSMVRIKGDVTYEEQSSERVFTMKPTEVGDSYICREAGIYLDGHHIPHILEVGDIVVSLGDPTGHDSIYEYTVIQSNWTATIGTPTLEWGKSTVLASVGGINITATLPNDPAVNKADLSALDAYLPLDGSKAMIGNLNLGKQGLIFDGTIRSTISQIETGLNFTVGDVSICDITTLPVFHTSVTASSFIKKNATADDILLGDGTTTSLSSLKLIGNYLPLTGGTMSGDIDFTSGSILFGGGQDGSISTPEQGILQLEAEGTSLQLGYDRVASNVLINAPKFVNTSSSDSYVLLGGGGTKLLSEITDAYLPLAGGTMTGTITFNISDEGTKWIDFGQANAYIQPAEQSGLVLFGDGALFELHLNAIVANCNVSASAFYETSDIRKKNIKSDLSLDKCYDLIDKCQTVIYSLKDQTKEQVGMIALEIEEFFPEVVATDEEGFKSLAYDRLVVICFKVLKDVIKRLEKLENGL